MKSLTIDPTEKKICVNELKGTWIKFPLKYTALDCVVVFFGKHVPSFTKPKLWGRKNSFRVLTTNNIVKITVRIQFECGLLKVWKDCGMASDESVPLATYSLTVF